MPNVMIATTDPVIFKSTKAAPFAEDITAERQDLVQDELKKAERQIAPVETKERPKSVAGNAEQNHEAQQANGRKRHPISEAAEFAPSMSEQNVSSIPTEEDVNAYAKRLEYEKALRKRFEQTTRPSPGR